MEDLITNAIVPIVVALFGSSVWSVILEAIRMKKKKLTTEQRMLLGLGHDSLYTKLDAYCNRGYITVDELENLEYLYKPYKEMGGNGTCEKLYEEVYKLPHTKDRDK